MRVKDDSVFVYSWVLYVRRDAKIGQNTKVEYNVKIPILT